MSSINPLTLHKLLKFKMFDKNQTQSSCVADVEYDPETLHMTVAFVERGTYIYFNVPLDEYVDFETANSQGQYFNSYVRNRYSYERVG